MTVAPFVAPTVTPHHLAWVCWRAMEPRAMEAAGRRRAALHAAYLNGVKYSMALRPKVAADENRGAAAAGAERRCRTVGRREVVGKPSGAAG